MNTPKVVSSENVFSNKWINVRHDKLTLDNDVKQDYFVVDGSKRLVAILAITDDNKVVLVKQHRHPIKKVTIDIPGGGIEDGELSIDAAKRELLEETGYTSDEISELLYYYPDSGQKECVKHVFLARKLNKKEPKQDITERINIILEDIEKLYEELLAGKLNESTLMISLIFAKQKKLI